MIRKMISVRCGPRKGWKSLLTRYAISMYKPNPRSEFRVKFDFRVDFTNGGYVEGREFLLDLEGDTVSDEDLKVMIVEAMNLAKAGEVQIFKKEIVQRGEHQDASEPDES